MDGEHDVEFRFAQHFVTNKCLFVLTRQLNERV